ncbi:MAG: diguanylate cyclase [Candidatus Omnitrophota bacterium]
MDEIRKILIVSSDKNLRDVLNFCFDGWGYEVFLQDSVSADINSVKRISPDVIVVDVHTAHKSQLEICRTLKEDFTTALIPVITIIKKRQLRQQLLNIRQGIDDYLIKPPDPLDLRIRVEMAVRRSQYSLHSSALTGLPGGRLIEETLTERIKKGGVFCFGYIDIDNFKYFNDVYGYLKGDRAIKQTAYMLYETIKKFGNSSDFIGHIGGDDFVFITSPEKYKTICRNLIQTFDRIIPFHYSPEDRERGFIMTKDRTNRINKIPLMSLSVALINNTGSREFSNAIEINERVAEIKCYLKSMSGSKFMAGRRNQKSGADSGPQFNEEGQKLKNYKPLGQFLLEKNIITPEQLDEALKVHWERGIVLGEILKELGYLDEGKLNEALKIQEDACLNLKSKFDFLERRQPEQSG